MYLIRKEGRFEASHVLEGHAGACANFHGHSYRFEIEMEGEDLNSIGILFDFSDFPIKEIEQVYDHQHLNDISHPKLKLEYTSAECIARTIWEYVSGFFDKLRWEKDSESGDINRVRVSRVTVWETNKCSATYVR